jgi:hypothetical protein
MPVRVVLTDGVELEVEGKLEDLTKALRKALAEGKVLVATRPDGGPELVLNPQHVLYLQPVGEQVNPDQTAFQVPA